MSTYYNFYLGTKNKETNKFEIIGPYYKNLNSEEISLKPILTKTRSFIDGDEFMRAGIPIYVDEIAEKDKKFMTADYGFGNEKNIESISWSFSLNDFTKLAQNRGLRQGYVPLSDFNYIIKNNYYIECEYDIELISAEQVAEMNNAARAEWGKIAFTCYTSVDYIAHCVLSGISGLIDWFGKEEDYYIIMTREA